MKYCFLFAFALVAAYYGAARAEFKSKGWFWQRFSRADVKCEGCQQTKRLLSTLVTSAGLVTRVLDFASAQFCKNNGTDDRTNDSCSKLIDAYGDMFYYRTIDFLLNENLCRDLGFCPNDTSAALRLLRQLERGIFPAFDLSQLCEPCKSTVTRAMISASLRAHDWFDSAAVPYCAEVPLELVGVCQVFLKQAAPLLIGRLFALVKPETVCQMVRLCEQPSFLDLNNFTYEPAPAHSLWRGFQLQLELQHNATADSTI